MAIEYMPLKEEYLKNHEDSVITFFTGGNPHLQANYAP